MSCSMSGAYSFLIQFHSTNTLLKSLCLALIIALPVLTPKSLKNDASFALGNFTNR